MTGRPSAPDCQADLAPAPATASSVDQTALPLGYGADTDAKLILTGAAMKSVREIWWCQVALGNRLPPQRGVILIDGFQSTKFPAKRRQ